MHFISQIMEYSYLLVSIHKELCAQISVGRANVGIVGVKKNEHGMTVFPNSSLIFLQSRGDHRIFPCVKSGFKQSIF